MGRRRSKWRRTWQVVKKMMQEARKVRAIQSLRQCPVCGNPNSLSIMIKVDKQTDKRSAEVICNACGFSYMFPEIPVIADEFWVYSRVLDIVQSTEVKTKPVTTEVVGPEVTDVRKSEEAFVEESGVEIVEETEEEIKANDEEEVD
ncbi:MAG: hypothetical protein QXV06_03285 [Ignisphaera sp.]